MQSKGQRALALWGTLFIVLGAPVLLLTWQVQASSNVVNDESSMGKNAAPALRFEHPTMMTTSETFITIQGVVNSAMPNDRVVINDAVFIVDEEGRFAYVYPLYDGINFINVTLFRAGRQYDEQHLIIYKKKVEPKAQDVMLWIEQGPNASRFQSPVSIEKTLRQAKETGVTAIVLDVKGVAGYASYRKSVRTQRPYVDAMRLYKNSPEYNEAEQIDILEHFIQLARQLDMRVYASFNVFAEGSIANNDYAVLHENPEWETTVYHPGDAGRLLPLRMSQYGRHEAYVAFVNPLHTEARLYQLQTITEVVEQYDIDGIIIDRGRYDSIISDFSDETREQFAAYLTARNKELVHWPSDVYTYDGTRRIAGPLFIDWLTFRSQTIQQFVRDVRTIVDFHNIVEQRNIELGVYTGSWYDTMYVHGVNYASPHFVYDDRLQFPVNELYSAEYAQTSYLPHIDFLIVGAYQNSLASIERYITLANIVTDAEVPLYAGIELAGVASADNLREVLQSGLAATDGIMLFDLSQVNFPILRAALNNKPFVPSYQLGISVPGNSHAFIKADFVNENRHVRNINVFTSDYGFFTHTDKWGVEVVVDADGNVERIINKTQAMSWHWQHVEENNADIPSQGFVISANDASGERVNRQLIAQTYDVGDPVRAAALSGWQSYDGAEISQPFVVMSGNVEVLGIGEATVRVTARAVDGDAKQATAVDSLADNQVAAVENGRFRVVLELSEGEYIVKWEVFVDGFKTNETQFALLRTADDAALDESCFECLAPL